MQIWKGKLQPTMHGYDSSYQRNLAGVSCQWGMHAIEAAAAAHLTYRYTVYLHSASYFLPIPPMFTMAQGLRSQELKNPIDVAEVSIPLPDGSHMRMRAKLLAVPLPTVT